MMCKLDSGILILAPPRAGSSPGGEASSLELAGKRVRSSPRLNFQRQARNQTVVTAHGLTAGRPLLKSLPIKRVHPQGRARQEEAQGQWGHPVPSLETSPRDTEKSLGFTVQERGVACDMGTKIKIVVQGGEGRQGKLGRTQGRRKKEGEGSAGRGERGGMERRCEQPRHLREGS